MPRKTESCGFVTNQMIGRIGQTPPTQAETRKMMLNGCGHTNPILPKQDNADEHRPVWASRLNRSIIIAVCLFGILIADLLPYPAVYRIYQPEAAASDESERWIAFVIEYTSSDYNQRLIKGIREEARALGLRLEVLDANNNKQAMTGMIDDVTLRNVDGIMISHGSPVLLAPTVQRSLKRGIPVVAIHCDLNLPGVVLLGQDDRLIADMLLKKMIADTGGQADFVLIWIGGYEPMDQRMEVYEQVLTDQPGLREVSRFGIAGEGTALHTEITMKKVLESHPPHSIDTVLATWDEYAKGAARAIMGAGRKEIRLYGIDISESVLQMLQDPDNPWVATVGVDSKTLGQTQVRMLYHAMKGDKLPRRHDLRPVLITKSMLPADKPVSMADLHRYVPGWGEATQYPFRQAGTKGIIP